MKILGECIVERTFDLIDRRISQPSSEINDCGVTVCKRAARERRIKRATDQTARSQDQSRCHRVLSHQARAHIRVAIVLVEATAKAGPLPDKKISDPSYATYAEIGNAA